MLRLYISSDSFSHNFVMLFIQQPADQYIKISMKHLWSLLMLFSKLSLEIAKYVKKLSVEISSLCRTDFSFEKISVAPTYNCDRWSFIIWAKSFSKTQLITSTWNIGTYSTSFPFCYRFYNSLGLILSIFSAMIIFYSITINAFHRFAIKF